MIRRTGAARGTGDPARLRRRLRAAGMHLLLCDERGRLTARPPRGEDWLADLLGRSPSFLLALRAVVKRWAGETDPQPCEGLRGVWLVPVVRHRRRCRIGYSVTAVPTEHLDASPDLVGLCRGARLELAATKKRLAALPPVAETDLERIGRLVRGMHDDQQHLALDEDAMESMRCRLGESYEEIHLLYTTIGNMTGIGHPERFVTTACRELVETMPYTWIGMLFADDPARLKRLAGRLFLEGVVPAREAPLRAAGQRLLAEGTGPVVLDPSGAWGASEREAFGGTTLVHPIRGDGALLGLLFAGDKSGDDSAATSGDMKLLGATASHTAIFVENAALYDDLDATFLGTVEALTSSIDAKDRYTCGHSRRVAQLAQQLALASGLDEKTARGTHIAGLVHDVGKIGVPERVLLKPGRLDEEEFEWIRRHPEMGHGILKDIPQLEEVLPGVLHHHERWDGGGYPGGLAREEIPLVGRLIALADSFDAMSSDRTYRKRMGRDEVLQEIRDGAGTQFDPELAQVFVEMDFGDFDRMVREHRVLGPV